MCEEGGGADGIEKRVGGGGAGEGAGGGSRAEGGHGTVRHGQYVDW